MKGYFIAFEGANGVGKSTVISSVFSMLQRNEHDVFVTKEPSDSEIGILSRKVADHISGKALACLVAADRFHHVQNIIEPEIDKGNIVLCDRNILSAYVFNKMDGIAFEYTEKIYEGLTYPDLIILFNASPILVHERLMQRKNLTRYEKQLIGFEQHTINQGVAYLKKKHVEICEVSTEGTVEESVLETYNIITNFMSLK